MPCTMTENRITGLALEEMIHLALSAIADSCKREQEIRTEFADASLNGVDHWIKHGNTHILIQDKWREAITQPEISQFLTCADRLQARIADDSAKIILLWAAKREPTSHALRLLSEKGVAILCCGSSPQNLAKLVVLDVANFLDIDPTPALRLIPAVPTVPMSPGTIARPNYDNSDEGRANRAILERVMQQIHTVLFDRLRSAYSMNCGGSPEIRAILDHELPQSSAHWPEQKKVDFNHLLRALAKVCVPTKLRPTLTTSYFLYCKARYLSQSYEAMQLTKEYATLRDTMVQAKSVWAKSLPTIKWEPEPMLDTEYRKIVPLCTINNGVLMTSRLEYQFIVYYNGN